MLTGKVMRRLLVGSLVKFVLTCRNTLVAATWDYSVYDKPVANRRRAESVVAAVCFVLRRPKPSTKQLFGLVQFTVKWFFIAVIVYSLFDLAANSKLVAAPNVHMAETSDKTFDDVVGVDEVCCMYLP